MITRQSLIDDGWERVRSYASEYRKLICGDIASYIYIDITWEEPLASIVRIDEDYGGIIPLPGIDTMNKLKSLYSLLACSD